MKPVALLLALSLLPALAGAGAIYRHVDAQGRVTYTDEPPETGATEVQLPPINRVPPERITGKAPAAMGQPFAYKSLELTGAADGAVLRDPENPVAVSAVPNPPLREGDRLLITHNGQQVSDNGVFELPQPERGAHTFGAQIVDAEGRVLIQATELTVNVQRTSVRSQKKK